MAGDNGSETGQELPTIDRWLRFDAQTEQRYEAEHGQARVAHLQLQTYFGVLMLNLFVISTLMLVPDYAWESFLIRVFLITPTSLFIAYLLGHVSSHLREWLVTAAILGVVIFTVSLVWLSQSPQSAYVFGELSLTLMYANMLLALRFRHAIVFTILAMTLVCIVAATKPGLEPILRIAFMFQFGVACLFSIYANYLLERRRCLDYTTALRAIMRAEAAEHSSLALQEISKTDALTGLPNRRFLDETLGNWCKDGRPVTIFMIDVDYFKQFNDALGHPAGDDCLLRVARAFRKLSSDPEAFCARFGGEEFTLVIPGCNVTDALTKADQIVHAIAKLGIPHPRRNDQIGVVTVSVGVALKSAGRATSAKDILTLADQALYRAKQFGRNRFEIADDLTARTA